MQATAITDIKIVNYGSGIEKLVRENSALSQDNKSLRVLVIGISVISLICLGYIVYSIIKEEQEKRNRNILNNSVK